MSGIAESRRIRELSAAGGNAGLLFLALGVAADLVVLVIPSCAASVWQA
jgi:hypothetical protein